MKELSLHILDIVQNSIKAGAKNIEIIINESTADNLMTIEINDNGSGMSKEFLKKVKDPFVTTRKWRGRAIHLCFHHPKTDSLTPAFPGNFLLFFSLSINECK